ncbi:hypothetical protein ACVWZA_003830 [Sphingomonas sp. UYAg733]
MIITALALLAAALVRPEDDRGSLVPDCGTAMPVTRALLGKLPNGRFIGSGMAKGGAVLIGDLDSVHHGSVAFMRSGPRWRGWAVLGSASTVAAYRAPRNGNVFIWAMIDVEGAGPGLTQIMLPANGARPRCTTIDWPAELNRPAYESEFLGFDNFALDAKGRGSLTGTAVIERDGKPQRWSYRYTTRDGGRSWSAPRRVRDITAGPSVYRRVDAAPATLIASLRAQAGAR